MPVQVRPPLHDAYWRFAAERHAVFERRLAGGAHPWSEDPILARYKFCNTYRAVDRVTQYLIRDVIGGPTAQDLPPEDVFCRVVLFRLFSKERTWEEIERVSGGLRRSTLDVERLTVALAELRSRQAIYTSAFILAPPTGPLAPVTKHAHHLALVSRMFAPGGLGAGLAAARSLQEVVEALLQWPTIGPFLAYQIAIDLNYTPHLPFDEDEFTVPGPGALRGLKKVFVDFGRDTPATLIRRMVDDQDRQFARLGLPFSGLFGRPLHAIDCQGLFCEIDKYSRVAFPELKSARVRIKQEFRPAGPMPPLAFPARWGLKAPQPALSVPAVTGALPDLDLDLAAARADDQLALVP
jgi:hypothetical protein